MIAIKVPPLGESIVDATVARWTKHEGDVVAAGETLVELETDKITVEVPALKAGVLRKQLKSEGAVVTVNETLGELDDSIVGSVAASARKSSPDVARQTQPAAPAAAPAPLLAASPASGPAAAQPATVRASPAARRVAAEERVSLEEVTASGRGGVVSKPDVIDHLERPRPATAAPVGTEVRAASGGGPRVEPKPATGESGNTRETREKMSTRRRRIAEHLLEAQHATAHLTTFNELDMTAVLQLRERLKDRVDKEHGVRLTFMPFFVKAVCLALKAYPKVNCQVDGDVIVFKHYVHMGIAVAAEQGLVVPNIKDADQKGMIEIARELAALAARARDGKLVMDDLTGGTFTITNGGVFGSLVSTPILNYPQVGILGLHKIQDRPVAIAGAVQIRPMMYLALSYDHRVVEGQEAVLFLVRVKELLEDPATMLVT
jgi:2-oxoglutarate dehydrogenase E2 component (dihydrolipoamide succinyltransferase)